MDVSTEGAADGGFSHQCLHSQLERATNILLLAPLVDAATDRKCMRLLDVAPAENTNLLHITCTPSIEDKLDDWHTHVDEHPPERIGVIQIGEGFQGITEDAIDDDRLNSITIATVSSPSDLTRIGMELNRQLANWQDDDNQIVSCFLSITMLLQHTSPQSLFRLLHIFTSQLAEADAIAHYHMNPSAHDEQTRSLFSELFDIAVELGEDGDWRISTG